MERVARVGKLEGVAMALGSAVRLPVDDWTS